MTTANPITPKARWQAGNRDSGKGNFNTQILFPPASAVKAKVLADLLQGRCITHLDSWKEHGTSRLAAHIHKLRELGWPILANEITVPTSDGDRRARIAEYSIPPDSVAEARSLIHDFVEQVRAHQQTGRAA